MRVMALLGVFTGCTGSTENAASGSNPESSDTGQESDDCPDGTLSGLIEKEGVLFPGLGVIATSSHSSSPVSTTADDWGAYEIQLAAEVEWSVEAVAKGFCAWEIPLELSLACGESRTENLELGHCDTGR